MSGLGRLGCSALACVMLLVAAPSPAQEQISTLSLDADSYVS